MTQFRDGTIQSSNLPTSRNTYEFVNTKIYRGMIIGVMYNDDPKNVSGKSKSAEPVYSLVVIGGPDAGQTISGVRMSRQLSGQYNFHNQILRKSSKPLSVPLDQHDGDVVYFQFLQGNTSYPVIISFGINFQDEDKSAIKKADGPSYKWQYNGVNNSIDKNGALTQLVKGGQYDAEKDFFTPAQESAISVKYDPTDQSILFDIAKGKTKVAIDAKSNKITLTAGSTLIEIDGGSGNIKLSGKTVELGSSVSDFVTMFTELCSAFNEHTHQYSPGPGSPTPTTPPMAPLLETVGSATVKVQA